MPELIPPLICAIVGTAIVVVLTMRAKANAGKPATQPMTAQNVVRTSCPTCQRSLTIAPGDLQLLRGVELALCVRDNPKLGGRQLAEHICPHCEATLIFAVDVRTPEFVGANMFSPQTKGTRCLNCGKALRVAPWGEAAYYKRLHEAPLEPDYGLVCSKCNAVVCVACTIDATRNRTKDGSFVCPRCFRSPVDRTFHPV